MKIVLLGEKENSFAALIEKQYNVKWANTAKDVDKECSFVIIMALDEKQSMLQRNELLSHGLAEDKILQYCCFIKEPRISQMEHFRNVYYRNEYDSFWFGMSHSFGGLIEDVIRGKSIYKFSAPSMDIYYHFQLLQRIEEIYDIARIKNIYFELPYYVFNYDVSRCANTFRKRINFFYYLSDYHHFQESQLGKRYINMFEKMNELTGNHFYGRFQTLEMNKEGSYKENQKISRFRRNIYYATCKKERHQWTEQEISKIEQLELHVWNKKYIDTIEENRKIWKSILAWVDRYRWIKMRVIVFPFCPYFISSNQAAIAAKKKEFFEEIGISSDEVLDMFEHYMDRPEYFADECHLNMKGAYEFSKELCKLLE